MLVVDNEISPSYKIHICITHVAENRKSKAFY